MAAKTTQQPDMMAGLRSLLEQIGLNQQASIRESNAPRFTREAQGPRGLDAWYQNNPDFRQGEADSVGYKRIADRTKMEQTQRDTAQSDAYNAFMQSKQQGCDIRRSEAGKRGQKWTPQGLMPLQPELQTYPEMRDSTPQPMSDPNIGQSWDVPPMPSPQQQAPQQGVPPMLAWGDQSQGPPISAKSPMPTPQGSQAGQGYPQMMPQWQAGNPQGGMLPPSGGAQVANAGGLAGRGINALGDMANSAYSAAQGAEGLADARLAEFVDIQKAAQRGLEMSPDANMAKWGMQEAFENTSRGINAAGDAGVEAARAGQYAGRVGQVGKFMAPVAKVAGPIGTILTMADAGRLGASEGYRNEVTGNAMENLDQGYLGYLQTVGGAALNPGTGVAAPWLANQQVRSDIRLGERQQQMGQYMPAAEMMYQQQLEQIIGQQMPLEQFRMLPPDVRALMMDLAKQALANG